MLVGEVFTVLGGPTGGAHKRGTVRIPTVKMEWWNPMFVGSALPHGDGTPRVHHILLLSGPKTGRKKPGVEGGFGQF